MKEEINSRIHALRNAMRADGIAATIIPQTDAHQSEYLAPHWQVRRWLSGFSGSAGDLVVTQDHAFIWADSRYWIQAAEQLDGTCIGIMYDGKPETPAIADWLCNTLRPGDTVGIDGLLFNIDTTEHLLTLLNARSINLRVDFRPIDTIWTDRPALPKNEAFIHDIKYSGEDAASKIGRVMNNVDRQNANAAFISDLAEIAWTLNLRAADVKCNPVVTSFLYLSATDNVLFIDADKLTPEVRQHLAEANVRTLPYTDATTFLSTLPADIHVLISRSQTAGIVKSILADRAVVGSSPIAMAKAVKNPIQIQGVRQAMIRDGIALVRGFMELENRMAAGTPTTEIDADNLVIAHRKANPEFFDLSFESIAGYGPHGAIVHYTADEKSNATLHPDNLYLYDSGANYIDGTTDITRTISLGQPTNAQRHDFTLVMKGHIAIATAIFPVGTRGAQLDALARINLWKEGLAYFHGTGHGVGHFLNVHEGPQSIRLNDTLAPLTPGMITSNEPGLYREGEYGIRCENLVLTTPAFSTDFGDFLKFETLTLFPFDVNLFDTAIMTDDEIQWVNNYHAMVCERLLPHLNAAEQEWLIAKTPLLTRQ